MFLRLPFTTQSAAGDTPVARDVCGRRCPCCSTGRVPRHRLAPRPTAAAATAPARSAAGLLARSSCCRAREAVSEEVVALLCLWIQAYV